MPLPTSPADKLWLPWSDLGLRVQQRQPLVLGHDVSLDLSYIVAKDTNGQYHIVQCDKDGKLVSASSGAASALVDQNGNPFGTNVNPVIVQQSGTPNNQLSQVLANSNGWVTIVPATGFYQWGPTNHKNFYTVFSLRNLNVAAGQAHFFLSISPDNNNWVDVGDLGGYGNPTTVAYSGGSGTGATGAFPGAYGRIRWTVTAGWTSFDIAIYAYSTL